MKSETAVRYAALFAPLPGVLLPANAQEAAKPGIAGVAAGVNGKDDRSQADGGVRHIARAIFTPD